MTHVFYIFRTPRFVSRYIRLRAIALRRTLEMSGEPKCIRLINRNHIMLINKQNSQGFILPLAMIIIFSITAVLIKLMTRISVSLPLKTMVLEREQAKQVALMGVKIIQAQLSGCVKEEKEKQAWTKEFLTTLNTWQTFTLQEKTDGIEGSVKIYVSSEEGKIPINALWDFKNKKFIDKNIVDVKELLGSVMLTQQGGNKKDEENSGNSSSSILEALEKILKTVNDPLEDITQLLSEASFRRLSPTSPDDTLFAPMQPSSIILGDLFTVARTEPTIQPLLFSSSVKAIFGLQQTNTDKEKRAEELKNLVDKLKDSVDWSNQWNDLVAKSYGKTYDKLSTVLTKTFNPAVGASLKSLISVVSYGKVGNVTQKVLAVLSQELDSNKCVMYNIRKLYWL